MDIIFYNTANFLREIMRQFVLCQKRLMVLINDEYCNFQLIYWMLTSACCVFFFWTMVGKVMCPGIIFFPKEL